MIKDKEADKIVEVIKAARKVQDYLWGEFNEEWGVEEWRRMFRKRVAKIDQIDLNNPHWDIEFKKRLLQAAALSIAFMALLDEKIKGELVTNLPEFENQVADI